MFPEEFGKVIEKDVRVEVERALRRRRRGEEDGGAERGGQPNSHTVRLFCGKSVAWDCV